MTERPVCSSSDERGTACRSPRWLAKKWDAVEEELDYRVIGAATADSGPSDDRFRLARLRGHAPARRFALLPHGCRCDCGARFSSFRPQAIFASDPIRRRGRARRPSCLRYGACR